MNVDKVLWDTEKGRLPARRNKGFPGLGLEIRYWKVLQPPIYTAAKHTKGGFSNPSLRVDLLKGPLLLLWLQFKTIYRSSQ
jgi:hypothetical protein